MKYFLKLSVKKRDDYHTKNKKRSHKNEEIRQGSIKNVLAENTFFLSMNTENF